MYIIHTREKKKSFCMKGLYCMLVEGRIGTSQKKIIHNDTYIQWRITNNTKVQCILVVETDEEKNQ